MRIIFLFFATIICSLNIFGQDNAFLTQPSISPDNKEIIFMSSGDIWTVPFAGGAAQLLISHPARESNPIFSPNGKMIAFNSNRTGNGDIYIYNLANNVIKRLTFDDVQESLEAFSVDGNYIYFSSISQDISGMSDIFRVSVDGGTPMAFSNDLYLNEFGAAPSPDGKNIAITTRGMSNIQWWRNGSSHIDKTEIWTKTTDNTPEYIELIEREARQKWPMWSPDSNKLYYVSDKGGTENLWVKENGTETNLSNFQNGRVLWANISTDGKWIVFERDFKIWKFNTETRKTEKLDIKLRGNSTLQLTKNYSDNNTISEYDLSPDGKKTAFISRGEVFATSIEESSTPYQVTNTSSPESFVFWNSSSESVIYSSERNGKMLLYAYDFKMEKESQLTNKGNDALAIFSPDGDTFAFVRDAREIFIYDFAKKQEKKLCDIYTDAPPLLDKTLLTWSPKGDYIAFLSKNPDNRSYTNVYVADVKSGNTRPVSFLANSFSSTVNWSPDGTFILFNTAQRTEDGKIARIELKLQPPKFKEDSFRDFFVIDDPKNPEVETNSTETDSSSTDIAKQIKDKAKKPQKKDEKSETTEIYFDDINKRLSILGLPIDAGNQIISPDGKTLILQAVERDEINIYSISLDEFTKDRSLKQLTSSATYKYDLQYSPDGSEVYFIESGNIKKVNIAKGEVKHISINYSIRTDFEKDKMELFGQTWRYLKDHFYDIQYHGADWDKIRDIYEPYIIAAKNMDEVHRLLSMMLGELNASHLGIRDNSNDFPAEEVGKLGLRFNRLEYEKNGKLKIEKIIALSPAFINDSINVGDYVLAVDGVPIETTTNLNELLLGKMDKRVSIAISNNGNPSNSKEVALKPISTSNEKALLYRQWVEENRAYVTKISDNRLGYVHIPDMSYGSLEQLTIDLDAENQAKEGVVVDIRNNNGGFVNPYVIDILSRKGYLTFKERGFGEYPARSALGQRSLERPSVLVTNQHSLSDAEDLTEGYRSLTLGKVVGEPTAGWIIFTWNSSLYNGSTLRLPRLGVLDNEGKDMELNPRKVDFEVIRPLGESHQNRDSQLIKAVDVLIKQIDSGK